MTDQTTTAPAEAADLFEIIRTTRSMWGLKTDPVPNRRTCCRASRLSADLIQDWHSTGIIP
jgi:hypothetical protein